MTQENKETENQESKEIFNKIQEDTLWEKIVPSGEKVAEMFPTIMVDITRLLFSRLNPNVMDKPRFEYLKRTMEKYKYCEYAVVAPKDANNPNTDYYILDGAHRILLLAEQGYKTVPVTVVKDMKAAAILLASFSFNKPRGELDGVKISQLLTYGLREFGEKDIVEWSSLNKTYVDEYVVTTKMADAQVVSHDVAQKKEERQKIDQVIVQSGMREIKSEPVQDFGGLITLFLKKDKLDYVKTTLLKFGNDLSESAYKLCTEYNKLTEKK